jgi:hypothetical protein
MTGVERLLAEYRKQYQALGKVDPQPFLAQVEGVNRVELAALIDGFLAQASEPPFDAAAFARFQADDARAALVERVLDDATLQDLIGRSRIKRSEFVRQLSIKLRLSGRETQVRRRLRDIENGDAPVERVRPAVWSAVGELLGESADRVRRAAENARSVGAAGTPWVAYARVGQDVRRVGDSPIEPDQTELAADSVFFEGEM